MRTRDGVEPVSRRDRARDAAAVACLTAPEEEVSDFIQEHNNHFPELEAQAEALAHGAHLAASDIEVRLLDHLRKVLKVTVYLTDMKDYDGMNETYLGRFGPEPPVRTTVAISAIPDRTLVEMDCIAQI